MQFKSKSYAVENLNYIVTFLLQFDYDSSCCVIVCLAGRNIKESLNNMD